jgi:hypothetical protein
MERLAMAGDTEQVVQHGTWIAGDDLERVASFHRYIAAWPEARIHRSDSVVRLIRPEGG